MHSFVSDPEKPSNPNVTFTTASSGQALHITHQVSIMIIYDHLIRRGVTHHPPGQYNDYIRPSGEALHISHQVSIMIIYDRLIRRGVTHHSPGQYNDYMYCIVTSKMLYLCKILISKTYYVNTIVILCAGVGACVFPEHIVNVTVRLIEKDCNTLLSADIRRLHLQFIVKNLYE